MRRITTLLYKDFLNSFIMKVPYYWKSKKERKKLLLYPFLFLMFGMYVYLGVKYFIDWIDGYDKVGLGDVYLGQSVLVYTGILLFSIVTMTIANFYYSNDVSILLPLPIKKSEILLSKIIYNSLSLSVTALLIVFPFMVRYGSYYDRSILFYIQFIVGLYAHTLVITSVFTFIVVALMSVINRFARAKNIMQVLSTILILGLSFGLSYLINSQSASDTIGLDVMKATAQKMRNIVYMIPTIGLLMKGVNGQILSYILLIALGLGSAYLVAQISGGLLTKGILSNQSVVKRRRLSIEERQKAFKKDSIFTQIVKKDLRDVLKTPVYITSTLLMGIVMPLALMIPIFSRGVSISEITDVSSGIFNLLADAFGKQNLVAVVIIALTVIMLFFATSATNTAGTSITREGKYIWIMQVIPVEARTQVSARILAAMIIHFISLIPVTIIAFVFLRPPVLYALLYFVVLFAIGFFASSLGILLDATRPKIDWQTPQQAMKSNFNALILTYFTMILSLVIGVGAYILITNDTFGDNQLILAAILLVLAFIIAGIILYHLAVKTLEKKMSSY